MPPSKSLLSSVLVALVFLGSAVALAEKAPRRFVLKIESEDRVPVEFSGTLTVDGERRSLTGEKTPYEFACRDCQAVYGEFSTVGRYRTVRVRAGVARRLLSSKSAKMSGTRFVSVSWARGKGPCLSDRARGCSVPAPAAKVDKPVARAAGFAELLGLAKSDAAVVDYRELRELWTGESGYDPNYARSRAYKEALRELVPAMATSEWETVVAKAESMLALCPIDIRAHELLSRARKKQGMPDDAAMHERLADGLLHSIVDGVEGGSPDRAFFVVSHAEQEAVLEWAGYTLDRHNVQKSGLVALDAVRGTHRDSGEERVFFFDVSLIAAHAGR